MNTKLYITEINTGGVWRIIKLHTEYSLEKLQKVRIKKCFYINFGATAFFKDYDWFRCDENSIRFSTDEEIQFMELCINKNHFIDGGFINTKCIQNYEIY